ncbi:TonB-dependent receptor [Sphingobium herbicidovorans]|uniref:TonB-dependent receptor n=1 Tax=Sphingobium herbicidovorans TaxID=76947 RepID=UPI000690B1C4|nr:TonB-dependent receptor [Sphingobium herbicidovorans]
MSDIIVTAQRRAERAQDVPIVVTAFSGERLRQLNVTEPQNLYGSVPSLVSGTQGQATRDVQSYSIRGQSTGYLSSPGVAVYMSEVPLPSAVTLNLQGAPGQFVDLEDVQVLSGPQGTLFGRNTTGGAVLLRPRRPTNNAGGYVEASIGNYDLRAAEGAVNLPIVDDKLMVRVAGAYQDRRGYTKDLVWNKWRDDQHWYTGRIGILMRPSERFENYLLAYGTRSSNNGSGNVHRGFNIAGLQTFGFCVEPPFTPPGPSGIAVSCDVYRRQTEIADQIGPRRTRGNVDSYSEIESWGVINTSSFELTDGLTLRNIVSYQKLKDDYGADLDATPIQQFEGANSARQPDFPIAGFTDDFGLPLTGAYRDDGGFDLPQDYIKQFTEELQMQGVLLDNDLNFVIGGFYYDAKPAGQWGINSVVFCPAAFTGLCAPQETRNGVSNKSKALYAQATLDLGAFSPALENIRLTAGYRYTWDTIEGSNLSYARNADGLTATCVFNGAPRTDVPIAQIASCGYSARLKSSAPTWTLGADYRPIKDLLVYAKISRGYKAGGFNTQAVRPETRTFLPEKVTVYEVGFKSDWRFADMPVRINAGYYYSSYSNIQRPGGDVNPVTNVAGAAIYAAEARIQGIEADVSIRPARGLEIGSTISHTDAKYKRYMVPAFNVAAGCQGPVFPSGNPAAPNFADLSCAPFQFVTPWIYSVHASIDLPIPSRMGELSLYTTYNRVSSQYTAPGPFEPGALLKGYGLLNASLTWRNIGGGLLDATLFANNITNKLYRVSNTNSLNSLLVISSLYGEPRMLGFRLRYRFGQ